MSTPLAIALVCSGQSWTLPGRRAVLLGTVDDGLIQAWMHPRCVARQVTLRVGEAAATTVGVTLTPDEVTRRSEATGADVTERWLVALEHPVIVWEVEAPDAVPLRAEWIVDGDPGGVPITCTLSSDGRQAELRWPEDRFQLFIDVEDGAVSVEPAPGASVKIAVHAAGQCRIRLTGAVDATDLDRSRQMLARRGVAGIRAQRADHARELATYATSIDVPDPAVVEAFEWAKVRMDGLLVGTPGVGRGLVSGYDLDPAGGAGAVARHRCGEACTVALAQLAAGDRNGPRDTLKFLSLTMGADGQVAEEASTSGSIRLGTAGIPHYLLLAARYAAWTGELDFLARRWTAIRRAVTRAVADRAWTRGDAVTGLWARALTALPPLAEALGHLETAESLAVHAEVARACDPVGSHEPWTDGELSAWRDRARRLVHEGGDPRAWVDVCLGAVEGLWGVRPGALDGAVRISPWFPEAWDAMSIERLRVGRTVFGVRMRRRFGQVAARVERMHGPRMHVEFMLRGAPPTATVQLDEVELHGDRIAFEAEGRHALVWHF